MARILRSDGLILGVVVLVAAAAVFLLTWSAVSAAGIDAKAATIAKTARGINDETDSIMQLTRTNALARQILHAAQPLDSELGQVSDTARSIDGHAGSIRGHAAGIDASAQDIGTSAHGIEGHAQRIHGSARGIDTQAGNIVHISRVLRHDVALINLALDRTIPIAAAIHRDTSTIAVGGQRAKHLTACIDEEVHGAQSAKGGCR